MEGFEKTQSEDPEVCAERELQRLLDDPENQFLEKIPANDSYITNAETAVDALAFAKARIRERQERSFQIVVPENVEEAHISYEGVRRTLQRINESSRQIGEGGDANVMVSTVEAVQGVSEICYKFSKEAETPRGRNTMSQELEVHNRAYDVITTQAELQIGVPSPYYYCEMAGQKLIGMEKLRARSVDDLLRGFGSLPEWFGEEEIDQFCDELAKTIDVLHEHNLYHRDLHKGNVMITQALKRDEAEKLGYIIDFGLSGAGHEGMDPYKKEVSGQVFTYADDYGRIESFRQQLKALKTRKS